MGVETYQSLILMFLALQHQFTRFIEHRPELMEEMNMYDDQYTRLTYQPALDLDYLNLDMDKYHDLQEGQTSQQAVDFDFDWLNQLTELEEQTLVLEERLHRAMIKILRSQRCVSRSWKDVRNIQGRLNKLQAELRAAIETLEGGSTGRYRRRIFSNRRSMLEQKNQVRERSPLRFWSCPNISSMLEDMEFDIVRKTVSLNRTIAFKDYLEDMLVIDEVIDNDLNFLDMSRQYTMMKLKKTSDFPTCQSTEQAAGQGNKSDSSGVRETARNATSHSSGQSGQHHVNAMHMGHSEQHRGHRSLQSHALRVTTTAASTSGAPGHRSLQFCTPRVTTTAATTFGAPGHRSLQSCALRATTTAASTSGAPGHCSLQSRALRVTTNAASTSGALGHCSLQSCTPRVTTTAATTFGAPGHRSLQSWALRDTTPPTTTTAASTSGAPGRRILQPCALRVTTTAVPTSGARRLSLRIPHNVTTTATTTTAAPTSRERIQSISLQNVSEICHSGASAQPDNESRSPEVKKVNHEKVPTTGKKTSGSPSFFLTNISTAIRQWLPAVLPF